MKHFKRKLTTFVILFFLIILFTGCSITNKLNHQENPITDSSFLLNTIVTIKLYDTTNTKIIDGCFDICRKYENLFSRTIETSELFKVNHRRKDEIKIKLSDPTADLIKKGLEYSQISNGAFDITIEPLSTLWNFTSENPKVPEASAIQTAVKQVNYKNIELEGDEIRFLSPETRLDSGAIAKGYIADRIKEYLVEQGVKSAVIDLGGNILCVGTKPGGSPFKIGIQKPFHDRKETAAVMDICDLSVVSSGVYERHFILNNKNYHHLLDPKTGYPYQNGLVSVTIISKESVDGDGLSTACFALGLEKGMELINQTENTYAVFITDDYKLHYSKGFQDAIPSYEQN